MEPCENSLVAGLDDNTKNSENNKNYTDSSMHLSALPSYIRLLVFKMCESSDLRSLSLCCKWIHDEVVPILWLDLQVSWYRLEEFTTALRKHQCTSKIRKIHYVSCLEFHGDGNGDLSIPEKDRGYLSYGFGYFLQYCEEERVKSLKICDFLPANGLRLVCETFHKLQDLQIQCIHGANWDYLSHLPASIEHLSLQSCSILKQHWETICRMENLETLEIPGCQWITSDDFSNVKEFKLMNLARLDLSATNANDDFIATVCNVCSKLIEIQLNFTVLTDLGMAAIGHMPALKSLCMAHLNYITDRGMFFISKMQALRSLTMTFCNGLSTECLKYIGTMKNLECLLLSGSCREATDEDFAHIGNLTSLTAIDIPHMHMLTNASLELISTLETIEHLDLGNSQGFTDDGLEHLAKLPFLQRIRLLEGTNITLQGLESYGLKDLLDNNDGTLALIMGSGG